MRNRSTTKFKSIAMARHKSEPTQNRPKQTKPECEEAHKKLILLNSSLTFVEPINKKNACVSRFWGWKQERMSNLLYLLDKKKQKGEERIFPKVSRHNGIGKGGKG